MFISFGFGWSVVFVSGPRSFLKQFRVTNRSVIPGREKVLGSLFSKFALVSIPITGSGQLRSHGSQNHPFSHRHVS